jgi:hypothetical protein
MDLDKIIKFAEGVWKRLRLYDSAHPLEPVHRICRRKTWRRNSRRYPECHERTNIFLRSYQLGLGYDLILCRP